MDMQVVSALVGTLVGVTASGAIAWINQKTLNRRELIRDEFRMRQTIYGEFIAECARLLVDALQHSLEKPDTFVPVYALINRIRLCASPPVLRQAEELVLRITDQYFSSNLSVQELRQLTRSGEGDALKPFGDACRAELKSIRAKV
ncbi:MAG: hypothetical protein M3O07_13495 [Pseudomonadota bacterium]|nr:hypothetical protein [Pseudomonadota bacterium]